MSTALPPRSFDLGAFPGALTHVCLDEAMQRAAWCRYFGVFDATLRQAIGSVGTSPEAIGAYLWKPRAGRRYAGGRCLAA